jgi:hypothetical protein
MKASLIEVLQNIINTSMVWLMLINHHLPKEVEILGVQHPVGLRRQVLKIVLKHLKNMIYSNRRRK